MPQFWTPGAPSPARLQQGVGYVPQQPIAPTSPIPFDGTTGDLDLTASGAGAGTYGNSTNVAQVTVSTSGLITAASNVPIAFPTSANPTASVGLSTVNGSAVTFLRSDGAPALDQTIAPIWTGLHTFANILTTTSGRRVAVRVVTAAGDVTITNADEVVVVNKTVGAATIANLPTGVLGQFFTVKDGKGDAAANPITITPAAGLIDGLATFVMSSNYQSTDVVYDGTEWRVV